jgi:8-oxo-dGTP pyrophosphatase MutT (NUDIX family)
MVHSCGIFLINKDNKFLIGHCTKQDDKSWSIPKGRMDPYETIPLLTAIREVFEETNIQLIDSDHFYHLPLVQYKNKDKALFPFLLFETDNEYDFNNFDIKCNSHVELEGEDPFPEFDDFKWVTIEESTPLINRSQLSCLSLIQKLIDERSSK